MEYFDKRMALDAIEDALSSIDTPHECGLATGLCGAFYMCGLLSKQEWESFMKRISAGLYNESACVAPLKQFGPCSQASAPNPAARPSAKQAVSK